MNACVCVQVKWTTKENVEWFLLCFPMWPSGITITLSQLLKSFCGGSIRRALEKKEKNKTYKREKERELITHLAPAAYWGSTSLIRKREREWCFSLRRAVTKHEHTHTTKPETQHEVIPFFHSYFVQIYFFKDSKSSSLTGRPHTHTHSSIEISCVKSFRSITYLW